MGNILIAEAVATDGTGLFSQGAIWAVLFGVLLIAVVAYAICRMVLIRERKRMEEEIRKMRLEHRTALEETKQGVLNGVSRDLITPITLIISPLQQLAAEPLRDDVRVSIQMILRNAQLLLHQVNMLPSGVKGNVVSSLPPVDAVMTQMVTPTPMPKVKNDSKDTHQMAGIDDSNVGKMASGRENETKQEGTEEDKRFTMLMVDDSPDMCRFVHDYFRGEYHVLTASNGEMALERLEENDSIDLVVSDVNMPKMDGLELCKRIKTDLRWSHIPVILLTGRQGDQVEMEGLRMGADDYITKPFNVEMLRLRVKKFIEKQENRQRQFREKMDVAPSEITITSVDEQFIQRAIKICEEHMSDTEFSVEVLGHELSLSRTYLYKKLIHITGKGPAEFIRTIRLKRGKQYLEQSMMPIADIALEIGYGNPKRFTENFKAEYGMSPSEYSKKFRVEQQNKEIE
ncbi:MAG: response regulator [Bacteroidaceae bacterium]|nr:response regulator [Bacteroidaceae bacterium]